MFAPAITSGKGNDVAIIPSPKNRTGKFLYIRLKPFVPPVLPDVVSLQKVLDCVFGGGKLDGEEHDFRSDPILLLIAKGYGDCASR